MVGPVGGGAEGECDRDRERDSGITIGGGCTAISEGGLSVLPLGAIPGTNGPPPGWMTMG